MDEILAAYLALATAEDRAEYLAALTVEDRAELETALLAEFSDARSQPASVERNQRIAALVDQIRDVRAYAAAEQERIDALEAEAGELEAQILGDPDPAVEPDPVVEPETQPEPAVEPEAVEPAQPEPAVEPIAASTSPPRRHAMPTARHRPAAARPEPRRTEDDNRPYVLTASGERADMVEVAKQIIERRRSFGHVASSSTEKVTVAKVDPTYPAERVLTASASGEDLRRIVKDMAAERVRQFTGMTFDNLVAAGGRCPTPEPIYALPVLGDDERPAFNALPTVGMARGAITHRVPPRLIDVIGGAWTGIWTDADSVAAVSDSDVRKTCARVDCPDDRTTEVDTYYHCVTWDNLESEVDPELVAAWMNLTMQAQSQLAERDLLTKISAASTDVVYNKVLGSARDILAAIELLITGTRDRENLSDSAMIEVWLPRWARAVMRTDIMRQMPGDGLDALSVTDARITQWIRDRGGMPTWFRWGEAGQSFADQTPGDIVNFPTRLIGYAFPPGTFAVGTVRGLEIGPVRDSALNRTNDYELFGETHEALAFLGAISYKFSFPTCPDGTTSGTVDVDLSCAAS